LSAHVPAAPARLVLAPTAIIRARRGRLQISCGAQAFDTDQPALLAWVLGFAAPQDQQQLLGALPPDQRQAAAELIAQLQRVGVLVPATTAPGADAERDHQASSKQLGELAEAVYSLACDLRGFGPLAHADLVRSGVTVRDRLDGITAAVTSLRNELAERRRPYVGAQLAALGVNAQTPDLKLHIGAGGCDLPGWVNIDVHPAPLAMNLDWGLPFADGHARYVFLSHLLEHLFYPRQALHLLGEIRRVLAPGGTVRIVVPDIEQCINAYVQNDRTFFEARRQTWTWWPEGQTRLEDFLAYAGAGPNPALLFESHKFGYDFETLSRALERCGFTGIRRCGYMQSADAVLRVDAASAVAGARHGGHHYSLFAEASAPAS
jgi:SAM-dependent methyltransferase